MADYEAEVRAEMAEIKATLAAMTKSLVEYGKARVDGVQDQASDWSDEVLAESRRATKKLGKKMSRLERDMETTVREHPLQWFLGALGIGLVVAVLVQKSRD
jgi:ElaB/YqjD/DUF883 family membrane-anchored ribosome-binding protein